MKTSLPLITTSATISLKTSGTLLLSLPSRANSRHFSSQNISVKPQCPSLVSVCTVCMCVCVCVRACVCVRISSIVFKNPCRNLLFFFLNNIFHLNVHYVCLLVQRVEPQGRRFTNFHYYYYYCCSCLFYRGVVITKYNSAVTRSLVSELIIDYSRASDTGTYICRSASDEIESLKVTVLNGKLALSFD